MQRHAKEVAARLLREVGLTRARVLNTRWGNGDRAQ